MKMNLSNVAIGLVLAFVAYKVVQGRKQSTATKPTAAPIQQPGQWWSYAGSWGG